LEDPSKPPFKPLRPPPFSLPKARAPTTLVRAPVQWLAAAGADDGGVGMVSVWTLAVTETGFDVAELPGRRVQDMHTHICRC
jgi:hypothetical protein